MNAQEIISAMYKAHKEAFESFCAAQDEYEAENGEMPNWDEPVIYFDGSKAGWFDGGDAARDYETAGMLRFSLNTMEHESESVERAVNDWISGER